jgi:glyceraldehyde-3-phosphate dehydrogenase/erythrose-4-phosphate dehydrogenase
METKGRQANKGERSPVKLGINGLGRIGKLSVWHHVSRGYFSGLVINIGREAGGGLEDVASYIERDSTYGYLGQYLYGHKAGRVIENMNEEHGTFEANGIPVTVLRKDRNPKDLPWRSLGVPLVVDATGKFLDPTAPPDQKNGSIQGHLEAGAKKVIPEMKRIGFIAESVRIPTSTGSLIILVMNIQDETLEHPIKRQDINQVYRKASETYMNKYLRYSNRQNVSSDIIGNPYAAAVIEGEETHTRTAHICVDPSKIPGFRSEAFPKGGPCPIEIPVTQTVIYGWYDNELGSYTNMMGDLTVKIAEGLL